MNCETVFSHKFFDKANRGGVLYYCCDVDKLVVFHTNFHVVEH